MNSCVLLRPNERPILYHLISRLFKSRGCPVAPNVPNSPRSPLFQRRLQAQEELEPLSSSNVPKTIDLHVGIVFDQQLLTFFAHPKMKTMKHHQKPWWMYGLTLLGGWDYQSSWFLMGETPLFCGATSEKNHWAVELYCFGSE